MSFLWHRFCVISIIMMHLLLHWKHCTFFVSSTGVDTEFLVQLRLHHWYNIYIGYRCTATNWISGTRSYGEYISINTWNHVKRVKQCCWTMVKRTCTADNGLFSSKRLNFKLLHFLLLLFYIKIVIFVSINSVLIKL